MSGNNQPNIDTDDLQELCEAYKESWDDLEALEKHVADVRENPGKYAKVFDRNLPRLKLRLLVTLGATTDFFINASEIMRNTDYLEQKPLSAREVSKKLEYPKKHVYRLLKGEPSLFEVRKGRYPRGFRRGTRQQYTFLPRKGSEPISFYQEVEKIFTEKPNLVVVFSTILARSDLFKRSARAQLGYTLAVMKALGSQRFFEILRSSIPVRHRSTFDKTLPSFVAGFNQTIQTLEQVVNTDQYFELVNSKILADPLLPLRHWLEKARPGQLE